MNNKNIFDKLIEKFQNDRSLSDKDKAAVLKT